MPGGQSGRQPDHVAGKQMQMGTMLNRPPVAQFAATAGRQIANGRLSLGGMSDVALADRSVSARLPIVQANLQQLRQVLASVRQPSGPCRSATVVADNIVLTALGQAGGFYYNIYLNLPESRDATEARQRYFLGTLGAFELASAVHHGSATLSYPATAVMAGLEPAELENLTVSLIRVNGENPPKEPVGTIGELRVELSSDAPVV